MKYVNQKYNSQGRKKFKKTNRRSAFSRLKALLFNIESRLALMKQIAEKEGNKDWEKSKLAVLLITAKRIIQQLLAIRGKKVRTRLEKKQKKAQIKGLFRQLRITLNLARGEMQVQKELEMEQMIQKQNMLVPELIRREQMARAM